MAGTSPPTKKAHSRIAELLSRHAEEKGFAAGFGGDEFVLLLPACSMGTRCGIANSTCELRSRMHFEYDGHSFPVGGNFGAVMFESSSTTPSVLMQLVDEACYQSKHKGGGCAVFRDLRPAFVENEKLLTGSSNIKVA